MSDTDNRRNYLGGCLLFCALLVIQFSVVSVVAWIVCWCFGWEFHLSHALGINVLWIALQVIAKGIKKM